MVTSWTESGTASATISTEPLPISAALPPVPGATFTVEATRITSHYIWNTILPLIVIVMMSWTVFWAPPAQIATEVHRVLDSFGKPHTDTNTTGPTHIFNLGHGISQYTPPEHVTALVEAVLDEAGVVDQTAVEAYQPDEAEAASRAEEASAFTGRVFRVFEEMREEALAGESQEQYLAVVQRAFDEL